MSGLVSLLSDYIRRTNTPVSVFGRKVRNDPNLVQNILRGRSVSPHIEDQVVAAIHANPNGFPAKRKTPKNYVRRSGAVSASGELFQPCHEDGEEPDRNPCPYCQVRGELGCSHREPFQHVDFGTRIGRLDKSPIEVVLRDNLHPRPRCIRLRRDRKGKRK